VRVLVLNAGSSTLKWTLLEGRGRTTIQSGERQWSARASDGRAQQVRATLREVSSFDAVGHRIVHGGTQFRNAVVVDREVRIALESLTDIDPLHMPPALAGIDAVSHEFPAATQVAAFDTSFHAGMPEAAAGYGLPYEWSERWGLRRFGFHGLSIGYSLLRTRALLGLTPRRMIVCHLGSGCSVTALAQGQSVDTTMGFSPLEGVMMATRCGSVDAGLLLHLQSHQGIGVPELLDVLESRSGLLGVSGVSPDLRRVLEAAAAGAPRARLAYDRFVLSLRRAVGSMAGVLGGVDALVFTGGIGENSARVRADVAGSLEFTGLRLSHDADQLSVPDRVISASDSAVAVLVVHAREDLMVLDEVLRLGDVTSLPE
jgi:acetate kinase